MILEIFVIKISDANERLERNNLLCHIFILWSQDFIVFCQQGHKFHWHWRNASTILMRFLKDWKKPILLAPCGVFFNPFQKCSTSQQFPNSWEKIGWRESLFWFAYILYSFLFNVCKRRLRSQAFSDLAGTTLTKLSLKGWSARLLRVLFFRFTIPSFKFFHCNGYNRKFKSVGFRQFRDGSEALFYGDSSPAIQAIFVLSSKECIPQLLFQFPIKFDDHFWGQLSHKLTDHFLKRFASSKSPVDPWEVKNKQNLKFSTEQRQIWRKKIDISTDRMKPAK